jgi:hypothetical protein
MQGNSLIKAHINYLIWIIWNNLIQRKQYEYKMNINSILINSLYWNWEGILVNSRLPIILNLHFKKYPNFKSIIYVANWIFSLNVKTIKQKVKKREARGKNNIITSIFWKTKFWQQRKIKVCNSLLMNKKDFERFNWIIFNRSKKIIITYQLLMLLIVPGKTYNSQRR